MKANALRALASRGRSSLRALRDRLDEHLHPYRRRRAAARLARLEPSALLFVCLGNVCRSPYAAHVVATRAPSRLSSASGGFIGPGRNPPSEAVQVARARGVEHAHHVSQLVTSDLLSAADATFVFDRANARDVRRAAGARRRRTFWLGDFDPEWSGTRAIGDPWGASLEAFELTFQRIERCVDEVLRVLGENRE